MGAPPGEEQQASLESLLDGHAMREVRGYHQNDAEVFRASD
jgi:hypothetical protein